MPLHIRLWQHKNGYWYLMIPPALSGTGKWLQRSTKTKNKRVAERIRSQVQEYGLGVSWTELIAEYEGIEISLEEGRIHEKTTAYEEIADRAARRTIKEFIDTIGQKAEERDQL